jgi:hypothetical protein
VGRNRPKPLTFPPFREGAAPTTAPKPADFTGRARSTYDLSGHVQWTSWGSDRPNHLIKDQSTTPTSPTTGDVRLTPNFIGDSSPATPVLMEAIDFNPMVAYYKQHNRSISPRAQPPAQRWFQQHSFNGMLPENKFIATTLPR